MRRSDLWSKNITRRACIEEELKNGAKRMVLLPCGLDCMQIDFNMLR
jgi:hypothetical protein